MIPFPLLVSLLVGPLRPSIQVDPLLIADADQIWTVIGRANNPVWPGWDARKTPLLFYFPGRQDVLINHPKPPTGFVRYRGPVTNRIGPTFVRTGKTLLDLDGQNTSMPVNGVQTLVIADTLSVRRQWAEGLAAAIVAQPDKADEIVGQSLRPDPYQTMIMVAHEAFHVYQHSRTEKAPDEMALTAYPSLDVDNNVELALESDFLASALRSRSGPEFRRNALSWLAVRLDRRSRMRKEVADYEDAAEYEEGLAKYVEYRTLQELQGTTPLPEMWFQQGFQGFDRLDIERDRMISMMQGFMSGTSSVNNDLYGASPVRFRLYFSGMAIGAVLDRLGASWHEAIFRKEITLTGLVRSALHPTSAELASALARAKSSPRTRILVAQKSKLAQDGNAYVAKALDDFQMSPGELVIDYSELKASRPQFGFTPFGILRLDDDRNLFRLVPISGRVGTVRFQESGSRPVMFDRRARQIRFQLTAPPAAVKDGDRPQGDVQLPGVSLKTLKGRWSVQGNTATLHLE